MYCMFLWFLLCPCKTSPVLVGVEFLAAVDNREQFPFDVCVP